MQTLAWSSELNQVVRNLKKFEQHGNASTNTQGFLASLDLPRMEKSALETIWAEKTAAKDSNVKYNGWM